MYAIRSYYDQPFYLAFKPLDSLFKSKIPKGHDKSAAGADIPDDQRADALPGRQLIRRFNRIFGIV